MRARTPRATLANARGARNDERRATRAKTHRRLAVASPTILVKGGEDPNALETAVIGAAAGATTAVATTPLDVIKTRFMLAGASSKYTGILNAFATIAKEEGVKGLFAGVGPRVMWISIGGMIFFTTMEEVRKAFQVAGAEKA